MGLWYTAIRHAHENAGRCARNVPVVNYDELEAIGPRRRNSVDLNIRLRERQRLSGEKRDHDLTVGQAM